MSLALTNKTVSTKILIDRAHLLSKVRAFFAERSILEVDVPILSRFGSLDLNIELIRATVAGESAYLSSSPEYGMKRLLSYRIGDIYQLSHMFRDHEISLRHQPEFMMIEWYRTGFSLQDMIEETLAVARLFIEVPDVEYLSYEEAFMRYVGKSYEDCHEPDYHFAFEIQPYLGQNGFTVITDFPKEEAALAKIVKKGEHEVALRFELFYKSLELANGFEELTDPKEQRQRLEKDREARIAHGKEGYPIDETFLEALERGIPACSGVAVGFDRLMMLRHAASDIRDILPHYW